VTIRIPRRIAKRKKRAQHEVARDAEEMRDADLLEVGDQEVAERHGRAHVR
jgi:hypothetical protein